MAELNQELAEILNSGKKNRRHLIYLLQQIQLKFGFISKEAMLAIAEFLEVPASTVYSIATFYNQFRFVPLGKFPVKVCMGTACHLAGGKLVLEAMARELDIGVGEVTSDREFSLDRVACVGCCALAPVVVVGDAVYPRMTPPKVEEVLVTVKPVIQDQAEKQ